MITIIITLILVQGITVRLPYGDSPNVMSSEQRCDMDNIDFTPLSSNY